MRVVVKFDKKEGGITHRYTREQMFDKFGVRDVSVGQAVEHSTRGKGTIIDDHLRDERVVLEIWDKDLTLERGFFFRACQL